MLAVLLLHANEPVSVDRITDAVWGDTPPASASHAVQVHVSNLRKALGAETIEHTQAGYVFHVEPDRLDLTRFESLAGRAREALAVGDHASAAELADDALDLWRGEPLAEFAFADFARTSISRLEELRLAVEEARAEAELELGHHERLVPHLRELADEHPYDERLHQLLMLALYRSGRQADALAAYRAVRERLSDDLGLVPSPALRELERKVLAHDTSLTPEERHMRSVVVCPATVEGLEELAALAEPLGRARFPHELILAYLAEEGQLDRASKTALAQQALLARSGTEARTSVFTTTNRDADVLRLASRPEVDLLLLGVEGNELGEDGFPSTLASILTGAACDVAVVPGDLAATEAAEILVPFGAHEHDWAALELGAWLASPDDRPLVVLGTDAGDGGRDASRMLADVGLLLQRLTGVAVEPRLIAPGRKGLIDATGEGGLLVMGLSERWSDEGLGRMRRDVFRVSEGGVVFVKRGLRPGGISPPAELTRYRWSVTMAQR
ncbi:MAG TPA: AfsR/SARP family transcriptional regulator [Gaiellaceae bacterium]|nr:AfsR/SARP family transcriptional regulator [Gaiellaceae bacterium]